MMVQARLPPRRRAVRRGLSWQPFIGLFAAAAEATVSCVTAENSSDCVRHKTLILDAGHGYVAKAPKHK
jgi:hypothetical protein